MTFDILFQEKWTHIWRGMCWLILQKSTGDFDAGLLNDFGLPICQKVDQQGQTMLGTRGLDQIGGCHFGYKGRIDICPEATLLP